MITENILNTSYLIPLAPLAASVIILAFRKVLGFQGAWVGILAMLYAFGHAMLIAIGIHQGVLHLPLEGLQGHYFELSYTWFSVGNFEFSAGVLIDGLSSMMLLVVTLVALLVQIYSFSYMRGHERFGRYFAYINLFTFSMLILVVANNLVQFFMGWELVGLCSYLLIGFDFEREPAAYAGRKAFLTTKVGDLGMYIALLIIFNNFGTFGLASLFQNIHSVEHPHWVVVVTPLLLFFGAMGKSAQFPLHVWLPDAMEGPTPASALIHAATMVAAGVYMVARLFFLFEAAPIVMDVVAWTGVITALTAASMGLVASDIKRVLAFSTVSQLGFMMAALGCGGYEAGMFHLTTHAAFKALLFLCAGSVIHAVHTNDMWKMGGLMTKMPITAFCYFIGTAAIVGFPFTSGFYSKEEVLVSALHHNPIIFWALGFAAFLTSFYMFRSCILTFTGVPREKDKYQHAHESKFLMTGPMILLAVLSLTVGFFLWYPSDFRNLSTFIHWEQTGEHAKTGALVLVVSLAAFLGGLCTALFIYVAKPTKNEALAKQFPQLYSLLVHRYWIDEFYLWCIATFYYPLANFLAKVDYDILDQGIVDGVGRLGKRLSWVSDLFDGKIIDRVLVDGQSDWINGLGNLVRRIQSGLAQSYLFWMIIGLGAMFAWLAKNFN